MKQRIYLDTSVIGGCLDKEFEEWSRQLFNEFTTGNKTAVISDITLSELEFARHEVRDLLKRIPETHKEYVFNDQETEELANAYITEGVVTQKFYEDALHIALATIHKVDVLVSWNFKHIVNLGRIKQYNGVNLILGYSLLEIRNPRDVLNSK